MYLNIFFSIIFFISIYYLISYRLNLKKSAETTKNALFPIKKDEYNSILVPLEWKEMKPLTKNAKSYQYVKWGTVVVLFLLTVLFMIILTTELFNSSFFSIGYLFFVILRLIRHNGNLYILSNGIILNGKYYTVSQIKHFQTEQIVRWHPLYGLDEKVNHAYKVSFETKNLLDPSSYFVIRDKEHLGQIISLLKKLNIPEKPVKQENTTTTANSKNVF